MRIFYHILRLFKIGKSILKNRGKPKAPKYKKTQYYNLIYDNQRFQIKDNFIQLEKGFLIKTPNQLLDKTINQIEIVPKYNYFEVIFVYEDEKIYQEITKNKRIMAIDLGLNNLATCVSNGFLKPFVIDGKKLKSINQYYNKKMAKIKGELKKVNNQDWSNQLQKLTDKRNNKVNDYLHKASKKIVDNCLKNQISKIVIGNISKSTNKINLGKKNNQNFVNSAWSVYKKIKI